MNSLIIQLEQEGFIQGQVFFRRQFFNQGLVNFHPCGSLFICKSKIEILLESTLEKTQNRLKDVL